jgi:multidrug efflux pump
VFGLGFATILTLIVTPAMLMAIENMREWRIRWVARLALLPRLRRATT